MPETEPKLPPELERSIFEIAARSRPVTIPTLMLVAQRIYAWYFQALNIDMAAHDALYRVEPLLYRVICVSDNPPIDGFPHFTMDILANAFKEKPASFFKDAVHHVFVGFTGEFFHPSFFSQIRSFLGACTGITTLYIADIYMAPTSLLRYLSPMPLRHLTVKPSALFEGRLYFRDPAFRVVTHLHLLGNLAMGGGGMWIWDHFDGSKPEEWKKGLTSIPHLTHFAFNSPNSRELVYPALHACPRLECCILLCSPGVDGTAWLPESRDVRFVVSSLPEAQLDWQYGAIGGEDMWAHAEAVIAGRRAEQMRT